MHTPLGLVISLAIYSVKGVYSLPVEWASNPVKKHLAVLKQPCHYWASGQTSPEGRNCSTQDQQLRTTIDDFCPRGLLVPSGTIRACQQDGCFQFSSRLILCALYPKCVVCPAMRPSHTVLEATKGISNTLYYFGSLWETRWSTVQRATPLLALEFSVKIVDFWE